MKGDFTRFTFRPSRRYTGVLKQQGRVDLDADWNEYVEIQDYLEQAVNRDVIGRCGVPKYGGGFAIGISGGNITISAGRIYVDGMLVDLDRDVTYADQPDFPNPPDILAPVAGRTDLVYLDVWQRHITAIEDPDIREVALGGPDTTTRVQTVWQVKVLSDVGDVDCGEDIAAWDDLTAPSGARLSSDVTPTLADTDPCILPATGGYSGLENRLYRVEIHDDSAGGAPTFKWSRDNGAVVFAVEEFVAGEPTKIRVARLGRDQELALRIGDWVEVLGDETELHGRPGTLARILPGGIDAAERILTLSADVSAHAGEGHPKVRRWDQPSDAIAVAAGPLDLEHGIQIGFSGADYRTGDYWAFAARVPTRDVERLTDAPPRGIRHHFCRLALLTWQVDDAGNLTATVRDCRRPFPPLTELPTGDDCCTATVGDGVSSVGDFADIQAAIDSLGDEGGRVCVLPGEYRLRAPAIIRRPGVTLSGCGLQTRIFAAGREPAIRVEGTRQIALESLTISAQTRLGAVVVMASSAVRMSDCLLVNNGDPEQPGAGAGLLVDDSQDLTVTGSRVLGRNLTAISLQARAARLIENTIQGGGIWVRDGSADVLISENRIGGGRGPGIVLGGLAPDEESPNEATGVVGVEILENTIRGMTGSGVATVADRRGGQNGLGDIEAIAIAHNRIVGCARQPPDPFYDPQVVGGVALRSTARLRIHDNQIAENGGGEVPACGVFAYFCLGLEITDNQIVDNGTAGAGPIELQCIDFAAMQPGRGPNPREEQGVRFEVRGPSGAPAAATQISAIGGFVGLNCGFQTEITLPAPAQSIEVTVVHSANPPRVEAFNSDGSSAGTATAGGPGQAHTLTLSGPAIARVVVTAPNDEALIMRFCFGAGAASTSFQAGIAALLVVGGDVTLGPPTSFRASVPAAQIHDNVVVCPRGHALLLHGLGPMSVADNHLTSQGARDQPADAGQYGRCVQINNLGRDQALSNTLNRFGVNAAVYASRSAAFVQAAAAPRAFPDGRVLFHGNQVTLEVLDQLAERLPSSVFIQSLDDISLQDNQLLVETPGGAVSVNAAAMAPTVRATANRFTELPGRAAFSYVAQGTLDIATENQATHCIIVTGTQVINQNNQILFPASCDALGQRLSTVRR